MTTAAPPAASAGPDQTVPMRSQVTLAGSGTRSSSLLTYQWQQVSGTPVTLAGANSGRPSFSAPAVEDELEFSLTVNDGVSSSPPSYVTVHVINSAPIISSVTLSPVSPRRVDAITEESSFARKNILVSIPVGSYQNTGTTIAAVDPKTGAQIWESPPLRGYVPHAVTGFGDEVIEPNVGHRLAAIARDPF